MSRFAELSRQALARPQDSKAIEFEGRWHTWGDMRRLAEALHEAIAASGAGPNATVAFAARNRPSAVAALLAMAAREMTVKMLYAYQSGDGLGREIARLQPSLFVAATEDFTEGVRAALQAHGVAGIGIGEMAAAAIPGFEKTDRPDDPAAPARPQLEVLTSGTTGPPKQFALDYDMIGEKMLTARSTARPDVDVAAEPPLLQFMPLGNISGVYSTLPAAIGGRQMTLLERFSVAGWRDHVLRYRPSVSGLPPAGFRMVLDADIPREDLVSIRSFGMGAAPLDPTVHREFEQRYGIPILMSYGATEFAGPVCSMTADLHAEWGDRKFGSVGRALPGAQLRVVDPNSGEPVPPGTEGILEVISPRIGPDWIKTADVAVLDEDGFLFIRGRADGAIIRGGFKLLPETIERALLLHPGIAAAGVLGVADRRLGEVPAAVIQARPGIPAPAIAEVETHLRRHLPATFIPTVWLFVDDLPKTPSFKVDRPALRKLLEAGTALSG